MERRREETDARTDDGRAAARLLHPAACRNHPRRCTRRVARRRRVPRPHGLRRGGATQPAAGLRPGPHGSRPGRQGRLPGLERRPTSRDLLRGVGIRARVPHGQSAALPRAGRRHHRPRRRRRAVRRPGPRAARRRPGAAPDVPPRRRGDGGGRRHAVGGRSAAAALLRDAAGGRAGRLRLARARRGVGRRPLLHVRDHRGAEGRALLPPLDGAPRPDHLGARRLRFRGRRHRSCRSCRCSMSTPGASPTRPPWRAPSS